MTCADQGFNLPIENFLNWQFYTGEVLPLLRAPNKHQHFMLGEV